MAVKKTPSTRKKRVRIQQNIISASCLACIAFVVIWGIHVSGTSLRTSADSDDASKTDIVVKEQNNVSKDSSIADTVSSMVDSNTESELSSDTDSDESSESEQAENEHPYAEAKDQKDDLSDAVFIGDSRTVGLENTCDKPKATFYCAVGLNISSVMTEKVITLDNGNMGTVIDALGQKKFKRVFVNFGTNELGWPYIDKFQDEYKALIDKIKELQPDAEIYAESIMPVTAEKDAEGGAVNNNNAVTFNAAIKETAEAEGINYLDCTDAVKDESGKLPSEASTDGIHFISEYCNYWLNFIIDNT